MEKVREKQVNLKRETKRRTKRDGERKRRRQEEREMNCFTFGFVWSVVSML